MKCVIPADPSSERDDRRDPLLNKPLNELSHKDFESPRFEPKQEPNKPLSNSEKFPAKHRDHGQRCHFNAYDRCLRALLVELKWPGEERHILQALPHFREMDDLHSFRNVLHHLGFSSRLASCQPRAIKKCLPCLIVDDLIRPRIGLRVLTNEKLLVYDGKHGDLQEIALPDSELQLCLIEPIRHPAIKPTNGKISWFYQSLRQFMPKIYLVIGLSLIANSLALATPIFTMNVYNRVIGSKSIDTLFFFVLAILATLMFEIYIRHIRGRLIAYMGARFNAQLLIRAFGRVLDLPISMTENAAVSQQLVRLRQFENIQDLIKGPAVSAALDLPFTILFIFAISLIHPVLAVIPLCLAVVFFLIGLTLMPATKYNVMITGGARQVHQNFLNEMVNKKQSINQLRCEDIWIKRWKGISHEFNAHRFKTQFSDLVMHTFAQSLVMTAGVATLWVGASLAMSKDLTVGALIAVMMFVWRILSPIQIAFLSLNRVGQLNETARQTDLLMGIPPERDPRNTPTLRRNYQGGIRFDAVGFRHNKNTQPVFKALSVNIWPRQVIAVTGDPASGKSTFLKMILGLYKPMTGTVFLDGLNLQQLDVEEVRAAISYAPQKPEFFQGTLRQNLRLANPSLSDDQLEKALSELGVTLHHAKLDQGLDTRLTKAQLANFPSSLKQNLSLARTFAKTTNIYLLDDPSNSLNWQEKQTLFRVINTLRGHATLIFATNDDKLIAQCDRVLYLRGGVISFDNNSETFLATKAATDKKTT